jgi:flagellar basal-body rod protein FlgB
MAMDASSKRRDVIANNIANAEGPNYKRYDLNFESELKRALDTESEQPVLPMQKTDPLHLSNYNPVDYHEVKPALVRDYLTTSKANGNNVDAEVENMNGLNNQMAYTLYAQAINYEFNQVNSALRLGS